jgi:iron(III) transport system permease protein
VTLWRAAVAASLVLLIGGPLALPFAELIRYPAAWGAWADTPRLLLLLRNTGLLVLGTLALTLPAGVLGAFLLDRTDLPLRRLLRFLTVLTLFVPLPLFASGWQAALGSGGWLPIAAWTTPPAGDPDVSPTGIAWKPWAQGLGTAVWIHAVAGLPWVILLVGQGFSWVEPELEEDALVAAGPWTAFRQVTLRRSAPAIAAAALWVALQSATEIAVTDMMQVRTFAEEVYTQFVRPERGRSGANAPQLVAGALAVSLPAVLLIGALAFWAVRRWERRLPARETLLAPRYVFALGRLRWPCLALVLAAVALLTGVPLLGLVWKTGLGGIPPTWSARVAAEHLTLVGQSRGRLVAESLLLALISGLFLAVLALLVCWLAIGRRWFQVGVLGLMVAAWALPGPVIGVGLKLTINLLLKAEETVAGVRPDQAARMYLPLRTYLYSGPSPLPLMWVYLIRFLPCAVAVMWPVVRLMPAELHDAARVDGAGLGQRFRHLVVPLFGVVWLTASLAAAVLALGELSAGKLVSTPGAPTFAHEVFSEMHYGVGNNLAALCLLLLAAVALGGVAVAIVWSRLRPGGHKPEALAKGSGLADTSLKR